MFGPRGASPEEQEAVRRRILTPWHERHCQCMGDLSACPALVKQVEGAA